MKPRHPRTERTDPLFPYTALFRSALRYEEGADRQEGDHEQRQQQALARFPDQECGYRAATEEGAARLASDDGEANEDHQPVEAQANQLGFSLDLQVAHPPQHHQIGRASCREREWEYGWN